MLQNIKLVENVKKLAAKKGVTAGQMALAWLQYQVQCHICTCLFRHICMIAMACMTAGSYAFYMLEWSSVWAHMRTFDHMG